MPWSDGLVAGTPAHSIASSANARIRVVAGPGTGKSFAMKRRVARLLEAAVDPSTILPVTFTRVAAEDLHRELIGMNVPGCDELNGVTLHSLSLKILMRNHVLQATGRTARPLNEFEIAPLVSDLMQAHDGKRGVERLRKAYEAAWARLQHEQPGYVQSPADAAFAIDLGSWLLFHESMLIGEVIPQLYEYLRSNPAAPERAEFNHILVDEFQDLNKAEQGVLHLLSDIADVCIVGDDDQSIYSFKHAHPEGIRDWITINANADDLQLSECRRCPTTVVHMANSLIGHNQMRLVPRQLTPRPQNGAGHVQIIQYQNLADEVVGVADRVQDLVDQGTPPGDILILAQRGVIGTPIYEALQGRNVPVRSYYSEAELDSEDAQRRFALLKLFADREDRVALRWIVGLPGNNWNASGYRRVREHCENAGLSPCQVLGQLSAGTLQIPYTANIVAAFDEVVAELDALEALPDLAAVIDYLLPAADNSVRDLRDLAVLALQEVGTNDREDWLFALMQAISQPEIPSEIHDVRIMSLHKSKGLSAPVTIIAGCVEGLLPKQPATGTPAAQAAAEIEEQRRLFFVGISRVKADLANGKPGTLILTNSRSMTLAGAMGAGITPASVQYGVARLHASRFIAELGLHAPAPIAG
ncbi:ATP-dependent helicase [Bradyrhizobium sp. 199]|uniref:UvrD-helicase domain-containing protein n=1 Tax=Bradyrhizobium sp. 199 TaxID=2782664 RepID=UPI001FFBFDFB|nr:ATP-dependent helicase [Bradyrhizobium sp. 199]MCK1358329.1 ATP-dependent helicase [Bradyrhizobium sp. 199]